MARYVDMAEVRRAHRGHWFDRDTLRFFRSRVAEYGYGSADGARVYFVSSERFDDRSPRLYSVRVCVLATGSIDTVGAFQRFRSRSGADAAARRLADGAEG